MNPFFLHIWIFTNVYMIKGMLFKKAELQNMNPMAHERGRVRGLIPPKENPYAEI